MTPDGFITLLGLLVALFSVMPLDRRLNVQMRIPFIMPMSIAVVSIILYLHFFDVVGQRCLLQSQAICSTIEFTPNGRLSPDDAAYLIVMVYLALLLVLSSQKRIGASSFGKLAQITERLDQQGQYSALFDLLVPNLGRLERVANRRTFLQRVYDRWEMAAGKDLSIETLLAELDSSAPTSRSKFTRYLAAVTLPFVLSGNESTEQANAILRRVLKSSGVLKFVTTERPDLIARLISIDYRSVIPFTERCLPELILTPGSMLYEELERNQNLAQCGYLIDPENKILHVLLSDAEFASRLAVYKPVGDTLLNWLRQSKSTQYAKFLNERADDIQTERWRDPTFATIHFFDIMVQTAVCQGVTWHMWLYYFEHFLNSLILVVNFSGEEIDLTDEWPTRAAYLIYEIFSVQTDWVLMRRNLDNENPHKHFENTRPQHDNGNIPKSAALCLGVCLKRAFTTDKFPSKFKNYLFSTIIYSIRDLPIDSDLRELMVNCIVEAGFSGSNSDYRTTLRRSFQELDPILQLDFDDLKQRLGL